MYILTNMHAPPVEGHFTDESGQAIKPCVVEDYNAHMGFVDKSDRMVNSYGIARRTWKWTNKLFFHLMDMTIIKAFLIHKSYGGKMTHKKFREILVRELIIHSREENVTASGISRGQTKSNCVPTQLTGSTTFAALAFQRKTTPVSCVFAAQENKGKVVFLQEV